MSVLRRAVPPENPRWPAGLLAVALLIGLALPTAVVPAVAPTAARAAATGETSADWQIVNLDNPVPGAPPGTVVGAVAVDPGGGASATPYLFNVIAGQVFFAYRYGDRWEWAKAGPPSSAVDADLPIGAVAGQLADGAPEQPFVFVRGTDGHLWVAQPAGVGWGWTDLGIPPGADVAAAVGVVAVHDAPGRAGRPYVFVTDSTGNLWLNWWTGRTWSWDNRGTPPIAAFNPYYAQAGVVATRLTPGGPENPQAFLLDVRGDLWRHGWDGSAWRWTNHGRPDPYLTWPHGLGAVTVVGAAGVTDHAAVYLARGAQVFEFDLRGDQGGWTSRSAVDPTVWVDHVGVVAMRETPAGPTVPRVFLAQLDEPGPVWQGGADPEWTPVPGTAEVQSSGGWGTGDAVVIRDRTSGIDTPYVGYWAGKHNQLMIAWPE